MFVRTQVGVLVLAHASVCVCEIVHVRFSLWQAVCSDISPSVFVTEG